MGCVESATYGPYGYGQTFQAQMSVNGVPMGQPQMDMGYGANPYGGGGMMAGHVPGQVMNGGYQEGAVAASGASGFFSGLMAAQEMMEDYDDGDDFDF